MLAQRTGFVGEVFNPKYDTSLATLRPPSKKDFEPSNPSPAYSNKEASFPPNQSGVKADDQQKEITVEVEMAELIVLFDPDNVGTKELRCLHHQPSIQKVLPEVHLLGTDQGTQHETQSCTLETKEKRATHKGIQTINTVGHFGRYT